MCIFEEETGTWVVCETRHVCFGGVLVADPMSTLVPENLHHALRKAFGAKSVYRRAVSGDYEGPSFDVLDVGVGVPLMDVNDSVVGIWSEAEPSKSVFVLSRRVAVCLGYSLPGRLCVVNRGPCSFEELGPDLKILDVDPKYHVALARRSADVSPIRVLCGDAPHLIEAYLDVADFLDVDGTLRLSRSEVRMMGQAVELFAVASLVGVVKSPLDYRRVVDFPIGLHANGAASIKHVGDLPPGYEEMAKDLGVKLIRVENTAGGVADLVVCSLSALPPDYESVRQCLARIRRLLVAGGRVLVVLLDPEMSVSVPGLERGPDGMLSSSPWAGSGLSVMSRFDWDRVCATVGLCVVRRCTGSELVHRHFRSAPRAWSATSLWKCYLLQDLRGESAGTTRLCHMLSKTESDKLLEQIVPIKPVSCGTLPEFLSQVVVSLPSGRVVIVPRKLLGPLGRRTVGPRDQTVRFDWDGVKFTVSEVGEFATWPLDDRKLMVYSDKETYLTRVVSASTIYDRVWTSVVATVVSRDEWHLCDGWSRIPLPHERRLSHGAFSVARMVDFRPPCNGLYGYDEVREEYFRDPYGEFVFDDGLYIPWSGTYVRDESACTWEVVS